LVVLGQIKAGWVKLGLVNSVYIRLGHVSIVRPGYTMLFHVRPG